MATVTIEWIRRSGGQPQDHNHSCRGRSMGHASAAHSLGTKEGPGQQLMKKQLLLLGVVFLSAVWLLFQLDVSASSFQPVPHLRPRTERRREGFLVNTEGCRIQQLAPFAPQVQPFLAPERPPDCNSFHIGRLVKGDAESVYVDWSVWENGSEPGRPECRLCEYWREELPFAENRTYPSNVDSRSRFSTDCKKIENRTLITNEEFVQVECHLEGKMIYMDFFTFPKTNRSNTRQRKPEELNVLLVGVDAVSRLNLHRQMPMTVQFLQQRTKSFEMLGYNKVGDNTFPNLVAVLSGLTVKELTNECWPHTRDVFDECPFVWKKYKNAGYYTAFAEDSTRIGLFNYQKVGFRKQPTDYYGQIFNLVAESKAGHERRLNTHLCIGNRLTADILLETTKNFVLRLKDTLTMGMFWSTSLSHDFLNLPRYGDILYLEFMEMLQSEGIFNTSVMIFLSDHGIRWGGIRETYQGYIEERLPFLIFTFPDWFEDRYPMAIRNLRTNKRRLTTPFDLHETLVDLIDLRNLETPLLKERSLAIKAKQPRGISLFLPIPERRTCQSAGITENWCTCHTSKPISTNDSTVQNISLVLLEHINQLLADYKECSVLRLGRIVSARIDEVALGKEETKADKDKLRDYSVVVETLPGRAVFEATVRYSPSAKATVIDPVSRLNTYGDQSKCISHYALKLYCYCTN